MNEKYRKHVVTLALALGVVGGAYAMATADEIAQIGSKYTCTGAEKAGTASGVAEFTGKYLGAMPGMIPNAEAGEHQTDPYAHEKPIVTITVENMAGYTDRLSAGQKAMFRKYPGFRMNVYPAHRDFRYDDSICRAALVNAQHAELGEKGLKVNDAVRGAVPFPFPKTGQELVWNVLMAPRATTVLRDADNAMVYPNNILWGAQLRWGYSKANDLKLRAQAYEGIAAYGREVILLPEREKGAMMKFLEHFVEPPLFWTYFPGCHRGGCRRKPFFDVPIPSTANTVIYDEVRLMNGSLERYHWKLIGKKEIYQPTNNFRLETKEIGDNKYARLLTPGHENPEFVRWELRRAWILEGTLKQGQRHLYPKRTLYVDEDSYLATMSEVPDPEGEVWRFNWANNLYVGGARTNTWEVYSAYYHDLKTGGYTAYDLTQAKPRSLVVDAPDAEYGKADFYNLENLKSGRY